MMLLDIEVIVRELRERPQREAEMARARRLAAGRSQRMNRPNRLRFFSPR